MAEVGRGHHSHVPVHAGLREGRSGHGVGVRGKTEEEVDRVCGGGEGMEMEEGAMVVVGVRMDAQSRELLTWALVKVAQPGDRVVALHIIVNDRSDRRSGLGSCSSLVSRLNSFHSVLSVYEGFCNLKQIDLKLKVCRGSSLRKSLVRETSELPASTLILGTAKSSRAIGSSTSVARYCARNLPPECSVMAVNNGKIVFRRETEGSFLCLSPPGWKQRNEGSSASTSGSWKKSSVESEGSEMCDSDCVSEEEEGLGRTGWPRRSAPAPVSSEKTMISTFQRALRVSDRQSASSATVHPDQKPWKPPPSLKTGRGFDEGFHRRIPKDLETLHLKFSSSCRRFSYGEIAAATSNFSAERLIGVGGSSRVYRGGDDVAVKILKPSGDALAQFILEIEIVTGLRHKNVLSLNGFCFEGETLALVYDYVPRGSLEDKLHRAEETALLDWEQRFRVAMGVAEALDYLHGTAKPVIHRDVKSSNILLADDYEPRLADFGLAQWEESSSSSPLAASGDLAGTFGYLAPEYVMYGNVDEKIDVYAFGVVLLELLTGKKPINAVSPKGRQSLVTWATPLLASNEVSCLLDLRLGDKYDEQEAERTILAASLCIKTAPRARPRMAQVLKLLQGDENVVEWAKAQVSSSEEGRWLDEEEESDHSASIRSHLNLAFLDMEGESICRCGTAQAVDLIMAHGSIEDFFQSRETRTAFDQTLKIVR
ncbi:protein kinase STUNTED-like isoform X1 [Wolffia australiana]